MNSILLIASVLRLSMCWAEYRVFKLQWINPEGKVQREALSTLDPLQYPSYYNNPKGLRLVYSQTWLCRGSTSDFKPLCSAPSTLKAPTSGSPNPSPLGSEQSSPPLIQAPTAGAAPATP